MSKFKTGLVKQVNEENAAIAQQQALHEKHHVEDPNVVVVEKRGIFKFTVRTLGSLIRVIAFSVLILLAIVGLIALVYPEPRDALELIARDSVETILRFLHKQ